MRQKDGFVLREVCGERVIVGEGLNAIDFGRLLSLNETAAWLWKKAAEMGDFTTDELAAALAEEYDVDAGQARADVEALIGEWRQNGIVE